MIFRAALACHAMTKNKLLVSNQICHKKIYITVIDSAVKLFQAVILQVGLGSKRHALDFSPALSCDRWQCCSFLLGTHKHCVINFLQKQVASQKDRRKKIINLAVAMRQREWFEGIWDRSGTFILLVKFTLILPLQKF